MAEKVNLDNAVDWNDYGVSVEGQPQVKIRGGQETPEWFDYEAYRKSQGKEGDWSAPEMKNPDTLTKIRSALARVKEAPEVLGYAAHKVADPMYANVDYMGQQVGDWAAKKINNIARAFDVSPEARQYGRFEEEEYDPEAVDVRFGRNAYKEGYDNLGDYLEAKDQEKVDRYRGYNHANRFAPIENADEQFYTLSDTQTMEDWQPETTSGKIAKGAIETAGNMLPENLKALMEEKGIEGGAKMLGMFTPLGQKIARQKARAKAFRNGEITELGEMTPEQNARWANVGDELASEKFRNFKEDDLAIRYGKKIDPEGYAKVKATMSPDEAEEYARLTGYGRPGAAEARVRNAQAERKALDAFRGKVNRDLAEGRKVEDTLKELSGANRKGYEYRFNPNDPYGHLIPFEGKDSEQIAKSIVRNSQKQPKPLPNPAAQRAEALARNEALLNADREAYRSADNAIARYNQLKERVNNGLGYLRENGYFSYSDGKYADLPLERRLLVDDVANQWFQDVNKLEEMEKEIANMKRGRMVQGDFFPPEENSLAVTWGIPDKENYAEVYKDFLPAVKKK